MPKKCLKCNCEFPFIVEIEGERKNLCSRKYCLECSPFKNNNTEQLHTAKNTESKLLEKEGKKICAKCSSVKNKEEFYIKKNGKPTSYCKECDRKKIRERKRDLKKAAVEYKGGSCSVCGYCSCLAALEFHHRDPKSKDFNICQSNAASLTEDIKSELDKCQLVCSNCHREIHAGLIKVLPLN